MVGRKVPLLPLVFLVALVIRVGVVVTSGFDGLYGQDAFAYLGQSEAVADRLADGWSPLPPFHWPPVFPFFGGLAVWLVGPGPAGPQGLNVALGALLAACVAGMARDLWRRTAPGEDDARRVGLLAGLCTAVGGQTVLSSVVVMSDTTATLLLTLIGWLLLGGGPSPTGLARVALAAGSGLVAVFTRWANLLTAPAFGAAAVLAVFRDRPRLRWIAFAVLGATAAVAFVGNGDVFGEYFVGWHPANVFSRSFDVPQGASYYRFPNGLFYANVLWHPALIPATIGVFAPVGIIALWRKRAWTVLVLLLGWLGVPLLFMVGLPMQNLRFSMTVWTPAIILCAVGVVRSRRRFPRVTAGVVAASLALAFVFNLWWWNRVFDRAEVAKTVAEAVESSLPADGVVLAFDITLALDHYTDRQVVEIFTLGADDLEQLLDGGRPIVVVVNRDEIERRWMRLGPGTIMTRLEGERLVEPLQVIGPWTISAVTSGARRESSGFDGPQDAE